MAYPYSAPAANKADSTPTITDHPAHHNALANALIDLLAELGSGPKGGSADLTARLAALDTAIAGLQPLDADLTAIAALVTTAYGRGLLTDADAAAFTTRLTGLLNGTYVGRAAGTSSTVAPLPFVNAKDFGAVGDGVTDDSAAITAAMAALGTPGGNVRFAPGTYLCASSITVPTNVYLVGQGRSTDTGSTWVATDVTIRGSGALTQVVLISGTNSGLLDIQVDGADAATSAVRVTGSDNRISGCAIKRGATYALKLDTGGNRNNIVDCIIRNSSTTPVGTPLQVDSIDNLIFGCRILSGVTSIVTLGSSNQLIGCHVSANTTTVATVIFGNRCLVQGNIIDGSAAGPHLKTTVGGALVIGNQIYNLGLTDNTYPAIDDQGANAITNYLSNRIEGQGASNRFTYAIKVGTNAKPVFIGNSALNAVALWDTRPIVAIGNVRKLSGVYYYDEPYEALVDRAGASTGDVPTLQGDGTLAFETPTGGAGATNLGYTASPTDGTVTSDTGADATVPVADNTNAGLMAPAEHTKLAGIEAGATADQTAGEILTAIKTVDGAGSGLDADTIDGIDSASLYQSGGTDVAVTDGGTGSSSASGARTNLGLVIGTDVEAHDPDLTTIAGLSPSNDDVLQRKAGAWTNRTIAQLKSDLAIAAADVTGVVKKSELVMFFGGGGSVLTTGAKDSSRVRVPFACTITGMYLVAEQSGSIVIDLWKDTFANYPPTVADTITASAKPTLSSARTASDTTLTGWTTSLAEGDWIVGNIDSVTTITNCTLVLVVVPT